MRNAWSTLKTLGETGGPAERAAVAAVTSGAEAMEVDSGANGSTACSDRRSPSAASVPASAAWDPTSSDASCSVCNETVECAICFTAIDDADGQEGDAFVTFDCGHRFCQPCVAQHVNSKLAGKEHVASGCRCAQCSEAMHPECPLCRRPIDPSGILAAVLRPPRSQY